MKRFAFVSRHAPTPEQHALAKERGIELIVVGDRDAFTVAPENDPTLREFAGYIVVNPAAALRLINYGRQCVGVFENASRPVEGGAPQFVAKALHLFTLGEFCTGPGVEHT